MWAPEVWEKTKEKNVETERRKINDELGSPDNITYCRYSYANVPFHLSKKVALTRTKEK